MERKIVVAGNWKMNMLPSQTGEFIAGFKGKFKDDRQVVFCVPAVSLSVAVEAVKGTNYAVGAQNLHEKESGAYTGEISSQMLADMGVKYVIIGHSERRQYFGETDEGVNAKAQSALGAGLIPIICVGETLEERNKNITLEVVRLQTKVALHNIEEKAVKNIVIAYEPVWAIGTGLTATSQQAEEVCKAIRDLLAELYNDSVAKAVTIQYGGSVNGKNAGELFSQPNIDGGLVGGASLKAEFVDVVNG
ncbi:MAG: triose-phosphate isomerase [Defluviitaleaceae bacterium]|nr:triose-phosphate isomerase [Defluviitaleaceae bacterium]